MNNKSEITLEDLIELLEDNELSDFDPVAEAFKVYDPHESGFAELELLQQSFSRLGYGDMSSDDINALVIRIFLFLYVCRNN